MDCSVTYLGKESGTLHLEQQGLYYLCTANCDFAPTEPLHLYAVSGLSSRPIGVLSKEGMLQKRISVHSFGKLPACAVLGTEDGGFLPWRGIIDAERIDDAYLKQDGDTQLLALPAEEGAEVPLIAYAQQMRSLTVCGRNCLVLPLCDGRPVLAEEPIGAEEPSETE